MKIVTNDFKNQIKTAGRMFKNTLTYEIDNTEITITNDDLYSIKYSTYGSLLKSVMRMLEFEINTDIPLNTVLTCQISMKVNNSWETLNFGEFIVSDSEIREESGHYFITCYDKMLYSMVDYETMNISYPITIRNYINTIATHLGLTFKNASDTFANYDKEIPNELYLSNTGNSLGYTFRDVLDELAQVTASTIWINEDGELELKYVNNTNETIDGDLLKNTSVSFKDKFGPVNSIVLSRSGESDNVYLQDEESIETNGLTEIKIVDNQIMNDNNRSDYLPDILDALDGTEYYVNDFQSTGILYLELYDKFDVTIGDNTYPCVIFNDEIDLTNGLEEHIYSEIPNTSETDYKHASKTDRTINQAYIIAKKNEAEIEALASKVVDISNTISGNRLIQLQNAYEGILHRLEITGNISVLYPSNDLYPSSDLYPRICNLLVDETLYDLDFEYLNYINALVCDKYVYEDGKQWVERNVGIDEFGNKYRLSETIIEEKSDINIMVKKNSQISMPAFANANLNCEYLLDNIYTSTFANQVEVTSELNLLGDTLEAKVSQVADDDGNVTSASIMLAVNNDTSEAVINANKIKLEGYTTINEGFVVNEDGNMICNNATANELNINDGTVLITDTTEDGEYHDKIKAVDLNGNYTAINPTSILMLCDKDEQNYIRNAWMVYRVDDENRPTIFERYYVNFNDIRQEVNIDATEINLATYIYDVLEEGTSITASGITTPTVTQTSKEEFKKNFEKLKNAKEILKNTDIYKYNLKSDNDTDKKHIGFVIGDKFNYSEEITSKNNDGVDIYSMISVLWQVVKEQEEEIKILKERIDK